MTCKSRRCKHCRVGYTYHPSGDPSELNDKDYCRECKTLIRAALSEKPIRVVKKYREFPMSLEEYDELIEYDTQYRYYLKNKEGGYGLGSLLFSYVISRGTLSKTITYGGYPSKRVVKVLSGKQPIGRYSTTTIVLNKENLIQEIPWAWDVLKEEWCEATPWESV